MTHPMIEAAERLEAIADRPAHEDAAAIREIATLLRQSASGEPSEKRAPVQGFEGGIPWSMHLRAYDAYCKIYSPQPALIDLEKRNCRGGFHTSELDQFIPGWRDELSEIVALRNELAALKAAGITGQGADRKPFKMLVDNEWMRRAAQDEAECESVEAGILHPEAPEPAPVVTDEMVEMVARAICISAGRDPDGFDVMFICGPNNEPVPCWEGYVEEAQAAIPVCLSLHGGKPDAERKWPDTVCNDIDKMLRRYIRWSRGDESEGIYIEGWRKAARAVEEYIKENFPAAQPTPVAVTEEHHCVDNDGDTIGWRYIVSDTLSFWVGEVSSDLFDNADCAELGNDIGIFLVRFDDAAPDGHKAIILSRCPDWDRGKELAYSLASALSQRGGVPEDNPHRKIAMQNEVRAVEAMTDRDEALRLLRDLIQAPEIAEIDPNDRDPETTDTERKARELLIKHEFIEPAAPQPGRSA